MEKAPDFELKNASGEKVRLSDLWKKGPLMIVFYPGDFTPVCTAQLCEYRDKFDEFKDLGIQIVGISPDSVSDHQAFQAQYQFPFPILSDADGEVIKAYKCTSKWTFGFKSRANCIVDSKGHIVWRYVEPIAVTHRKAGELKHTVESLKQQGLI